MSLIGVDRQACSSHNSTWLCLDSVTVSLFVFYIWFDNQVLLWDEQACLVLGWPKLYLAVLGLGVEQNRKQRNPVNSISSWIASGTLLCIHSYGPFIVDHTTTGAPAVLIIQCSQYSMHSFQEWTIWPSAVQVGILAPLFLFKSLGSSFGSAGALSSSKSSSSFRWLPCSKATSLQVGLISIKTHETFTYDFYRTQVQS